MGELEIVCRTVHAKGESITATIKGREENNRVSIYILRDDVNPEHVEVAVVLEKQEIVEHAFLDSVANLCDQLGYPDITMCHLALEIGRFYPEPLNPQ